MINGMVRTKMVLGLFVDGGFGSVQFLADSVMVPYGIEDIGIKTVVGTTQDRSEGERCCGIVRHWVATSWEEIGK